MGTDKRGLDRIRLSVLRRGQSL